MPKEPKVLMIIDNLVTGGAEQVFVDIAEMLNGTVDFDVMFILPNKHTAYQLPKNINIIEINRKTKFSVRTMLKCARHLRKYDILHVHMRHTFRYISFVKMLFKIRAITILHDHKWIQPDSGAPFIGHQFFKPDLFIGVSQSLCEWATRKWGISENKTFPLINLPSSRFLNKFKTMTPEIDRRSGLVMVGNIKPGKNQAFAINVATATNQKITIIGKNQDNKIALRLKDLLIKSGSGEWKQDINDVSQILHNYQLGILTSLNESGPLVLLEYLLCGLPFVAYKTGGVAEAIYKFFPEYFLHKFDIDQWTDRVNLLINTRNTVDTQRLAQLIDQEFNPKKYIHTLLNIYGYEEAAYNI